MRTGSAKSEPQRYTRIAVLLHWTIAALILLNLTLGYVMDGLSLPWRLFVVEAHISAGLAVLLLTIVRVFWRLAHHPPEHSAEFRSWERFLANAVHLGLYGAMLLMPLSGWALISANPPRDSAGWHSQAEHQPPAVKATLKEHGPLTILHIVDVPMITPLAQIGSTPEGLEPQKGIHDQLVRWHEAGSLLLLALLALHVAGALKHEWLDGEAELARMTIRRRPRTTSS